MFQRPGKAAFAFILVTVVLDMLALGVMIPVLPKLIVEFEGGDLQSATIATGVFGFAWAFMQFLFQPVLGALSDRFGRRPVVLLSNLGMGLDYVFMALAPSLSFLFIGRLISGVTAASVSTATAYIADITEPEKRAGRFGMIGAAFGVGFILGPALGGVLGNYGLRYPFWAAAALSLAQCGLRLFHPAGVARAGEAHDARFCGAAPMCSARSIFCAATVRSACSRWRSSSPISRMTCCRAFSCSTPNIAIIGMLRRPAGRSPSSASRRRWCPAD